MLTSIIAAAPIDGAVVLPDALVDQYVKPDNDAQADLLSALRLTAIGWVERRTDRSLYLRRWTATFDSLVAPMWLPRGPVEEVLTVALLVPNQPEVLLAGPWTLGGDGRLTEVRTINGAAGAVRVSYRAGFADVALEAPELQIAALMLLKHLFDGGDQSAPPAAVIALCDQARMPVIG